MQQRKKTTLGVVHVTATPPGWSGGVAGLRRMHQAMGWSDVGYNELMGQNAVVYAGRGVDAVGAHVAGFNSIAYGLGMFGGVDAENRPDFSTIAHLLDPLARQMEKVTKRYPGIAWCGHRDLSPDKNGNGIIEPFEHLKACPVFDVIPWAQSKGLPVANIRGTWKPVLLEAGTAPVLEGPDTRNAYLQRLLTRAGFVLGPIDGIVGPKTKAATSAFQASVGLPRTGALNPPTVARLRALFEANAAA